MTTTPSELAQSCRAFHPDKQTIEAEARAAAAMGHEPNDACAYPFGSPEGMHWMACYLLSKP